MTSTVDITSDTPTPPALRPHVRRPRAQRRDVRPAAVPRGAGAARDPARSAHLRHGRRRGCSPPSCSAPRSSRRSSAGSATCSARSGCSSSRSSRSRSASLRRRARQQHRSAHRRPRHPGRGRRDLPARLRDHPRRVPARARRPGDRADLGDPRDRRRSGHRARGPDRRRVLLPLALLVPARVATIIATIATFFFVPESPVRSPGRVNWVGAALLSSWLVAVLVGDQPGLDVGLGRPAHHRPASLLGIVLLVVWVTVENRSSEPLVDMKMMRIRGVWTVNAAAFLVGAGHVQLVHPHPAVRRDAGVRGLRLRRRASPGPGCSCCPRRSGCCSSVRSRGA